MADPVLYAVRDRAAWITLNRPENRNAFSDELTAALEEGIRRAIADSDVRALVIAAEGPVFCAGADLKAAGGAGVRKVGPGGLTPVASVLNQLWESPKPIVARIQGGAYGGGLGLIAVCDFAIAAEGVQFAFSEVRLGVTPAVISVVVLRKMGVTAAGPLFLTGERFDARRAHALHLLYGVVPPGELDQAVAEVLGHLRLGGPDALMEIKRLLRQVPAMPVEEGFRYTQALTARLFASADADEGRAAFREKRKPRWAE